MPKADVPHAPEADAAVLRVTRRSSVTTAAALGLAALLAACGSDAPERTVGDAPGPTATAPAVTPGYATGDAQARVRIQEWADFQCPFCAQHYVDNHEEIEALLDEVGARFEYYEIGAPGHPQSLDATVAARCAGDQGAYGEARGAIYSNQSEWSGAPEADSILRALVAAFVADTAALDECLVGQRITVGQILNRNLRAAMTRGVSSTPTTIVDVDGTQTVLSGVTPASEIRAALESLGGFDSEDGPGVDGEAGGDAAEDPES